MTVYLIHTLDNHLMKIENNIYEWDISLDTNSNGYKLFNNFEDYIQYHTNNWKGEKEETC